MFMYLLIPWIFSFILGMAVKIVCYTRVVEIYLRAAFAPIALSDFFHSGFQGSGWRFLKSFLAVCLQGAFILAIAAIYAALVNSIFKGYQDAEMTLTFWESIGIFLSIGCASIMLMFKSLSLAKEMFDIDNLPSNIEKTMLIFEKATQVFYEYELEDYQFLKTAKSKGANGIQALAAVIIDKVGRGLSEDYPEIFSAEDHTSLINGPEKDFIHEIITKTLKAGNLSLTARIQQAEAKSEAAQDNKIGAPVCEKDPERN